MNAHSSAASERPSVFGWGIPLLAVLLAAAAGVAAAVFPPQVLVGIAGGVVVGAGGLYWAVRVALSREIAILSVASGSLILLRLPILSNTPVAHAAALIPFAVGIILCVRPARSLDRQTVGISLAFLAILIVELLRGAVAGAHQSIPGASISALTFATIAGFGYSMFVSAATKEDLRRRLLAVAFAPSVYAAANIVLLAANITPPGFSEGSVALNNSAELLSYVGIHVDRINFPLGVSVNNYGVICAIGLAAALVIAARYQRTLRYAALAGAAVCTYCLLRGDSRASLLFGLFFAVLIIQAPKLRVSGLALVAPLAPIALIAIFGFLSDTWLGGASSQGRDISTGSGRTEIWAGVWMHLRAGNPQDLVGYGAAGQITSGAAANYKQVFAGYEDTERFPVHNAFLQQLLDGGYLGVLVLVGLMYVTIRGLSMLARGAIGTPAAAVLAGVLTLLFSGFTEVTPSYYAEETLGFLILAACGAATATRGDGASVATSAPARQRHLAGASQS